MTMPEFSVVVPAWKAEDTLSCCLEALTRQTIARERYEIIVVEDGSADRTEEIAHQFQARHHFQENQGPAAARNAGASLARGHLIFFTDRDCIPNPDWLENMAAPFSQPEVSAVQGVYRTEQQSVVARFAQLEFEERFAMLAQRDSIDMVATYAAGFRKSAFDQMGGFDVRFPKANNEDTELSYRMAEQGHVMVFAPRAVVRHLNHPDSLLRYFRLKFGRGFWRMLVYRMFPSKMISDSYTPQVLKLQIFSLLSVGAGLLLLPFWPWPGTVAAVSSLLFFLALCIPFVRFAFWRSWTVALLAPLLLALRAAALGSGALWGTALMWMGKDEISRQAEKTKRNSKLSGQEG